MTDSFLMKNNVREILFRKPAYLATRNARSRPGRFAAMARPRRRAPVGLRHPRSLRRHDESGRAERLSRRDARRHHATTFRRTTSWPAPSSSRRAIATFPPARCFSWSSIPAWDRPPRPRRRSRRLHVRGARQRRADGGLPRDAAEAGRRAHRAQVRARRPSAARSKAAIASRRPRDGWRKASALDVARARARPTITCSPFPPPAVRRRRDHRRSAARRSLRQPDHATSSTRTFDQLARGTAIAVTRRRPRRRRARGRHLRRGGARRGLRALRQHRSPRDRGERAAAPPSARPGARRDGVRDGTRARF